MSKAVIYSMYKTILFIYFSFIMADIPDGYYNSAEGLSGNTLKMALHDVIDNHDVQSYGSLHDHFETTDRQFDNTVWDMYSDNPNGNSAYIYHFIDSDHCGNYSGEGDCYNREHSWPKSWFNNASPMNSDLFHLYPTDGYVNGHRGNYPYGEVGNATWTSTNGSKKGYSSSSGYSGIVFEPIDEYKGDLARTYFYMSTRYYSEDTSWDNTDMTNGAELKNWAVDVLLNWHQLDPVSNKELNRNDEVYLIQENRNPFIDHPEWVECIWTDNCELAILKPAKHIKNVDIKMFQKKSSTFLEIEFNEKHFLKINVFNVQGKNVGQIFKGYNSVGLNQWQFKHNQNPSGIYFFNIQSENLLQSKKFIIYK